MQPSPALWSIQPKYPDLGNGTGSSSLYTTPGENLASRSGTRKTVYNILLDALSEDAAWHLDPITLALVGMTLYLGFALIPSDFKRRLKASWKLFWPPWQHRSGQPPSPPVSARVVNEGGQPRVAKSVPQTKEKFGSRDEATAEERANAPKVSAEDSQTKAREKGFENARARPKDSEVATPVKSREANARDGADLKSEKQDANPALPEKEAPLQLGMREKAMSRTRQKGEESVADQRSREDKSDGVEAKTRKSLGPERSITKRDMTAQSERAAKEKERARRKAGESGISDGLKDAKDGEPAERGGNHTTGQKRKEETLRSSDRQTDANMQVDQSSSSRGVTTQSERAAKEKERARRKAGEAGIPEEVRQVANGSRIAPNDDKKTKEPSPPNSEKATQSERARKVKTGEEDAMTGPPSSGQG